MNVVAQKRFSKRKPLFLRGQLEHNSSKYEVRIRDLSLDGALLDAGQAFPVFEPITLICGQSRINGIIVWCEERRVGIEFSEPITGKTLVDSFQNRLSVSAPKSYCKEQVPQVPER